jgi:hypothetical protein
MRISAGSCGGALSTGSNLEIKVKTKKAELSKADQAELNKLKQEIRTAKRKLYAPQSYSAQVIRYTLAHVAEKFGKVVANQLITEMGLDNHGWKPEE